MRQHYRGKPTLGIKPSIGLALLLLRLPETERCVKVLRGVPCASGNRPSAEMKMILPIEKLEPGMRLARDVTNLSGGVLLVKGTELTPQHLAALSRCGLNMVHVTSNADGAPGSDGKTPLPPELIQAAEGRIQRRFRQLPTDTPGLALIKVLAIKRNAMKLARLASQAS